MNKTLAKLTIAFVTLYSSITSGQIFVQDDFTDGDLKDGSPVTWLSNDPVEATEEGLVLSVSTAFNAVMARVEWNAPSTEWSIRAQARVLVNEGFVGLGIAPFTGIGNAVWTDVSWDGNMEIGSFFKRRESVILDDVGFDSVSQDVVMQLDSFDGVLRFWAWPADEPPESEPQSMEVTTWEIPEGAPGIWTNSRDGAAVFRYFMFSDEHIPIGNPATALQAGDADQDGDFDQFDLVQVQVANKYLTGQMATWGEGDWDGAPGGQLGTPPVGNGLFDQNDIVAALGSGNYLTGPYAAIQSGGQSGDAQTSLGYDAASGEVWIDAPAGLKLTPVNIDSATMVFTGDPAQDLGGSSDIDSDGNIFKATFGSSFGTLRFGNVTSPGLSREFLVNDLSVVGSLEGGGDLGHVDLIYVPEPSSCFLLLFASIVLMCSGPRRVNCES